MDGFWDDANASWPLGEQSVTFRRAETRTPWLSLSTSACNEVMTSENCGCATHLEGTYAVNDVTICDLPRG